MFKGPDWSQKLRNEIGQAVIGQEAVIERMLVALLAVGVSLVMTGIILRGFAAQSRRDLARRKQHRLDDRKSGEAALNEQFEQPPGWLERNFGRVANTVLLAGVVLTIAAFARR